MGFGCSKRVGLEACRAVEDGGAVTVMRYEVRVAGRMSELARSAFRGMAVAPVAPETIICGEVADDAHLHGLLERCRNLGCRSSPCARHRALRWRQAGARSVRRGPALEWRRHAPDDIVDHNICGSRHHFATAGSRCGEEQDMSIEEG